MSIFYIKYQLNLSESPNEDIYNKMALRHPHFKETINESHSLVPDKSKGSVKKFLQSYGNNWATALQWFTELCSLCTCVYVSPYLQFVIMELRFFKRIELLNSDFHPCVFVSNLTSGVLVFKISPSSKVYNVV